MAFLPASNLTVHVKDAKYPNAAEITDYRWIIEEDRTVYIDPAVESKPGAPVRILGGATVLWLSLGVVSRRLLAWVLSVEGGWVQAVLAP